jgi:fluoride exporter
MTNLLYIAGGGAVGALLRYWMSSAIHNFFGRDFPYGTLTVNVTGSIIIGLFYVLSIERMDAGIEWRAAIMIGLLGAFTTFSTFSLETLTLIETGEQLKAVLNITLSLTLCLTGCWAGIVIGRQI